MLGIYNGRYFDVVTSQAAYGKGAVPSAAVIKIKTFLLTDPFTSFNVASVKLEYQFSLVAAILNLVLRPIAAWLLYRVYQDRIGICPFHMLGFPHGGASRSKFLLERLLSV